MKQLIGNLSGETYRSFILLFARHSDAASLVVRDMKDLSIPGVKLVEKLKDLPGFRQQTVTSWPGTMLGHDQSAELLTFALSSEAIPLLMAPKDISGWLEPDYPEDLTFYRNGQPIFISTTHEHDFYFSEEFDPPEELLRDLASLGLRYEEP